MSNPELLPLWEGAVPCVRCGYCCTVRSCGFANYDDHAGKCAELIENGDGTFRCGRFEEIIKLPPSAWFCAPAFGAGCCSPGNTKRKEVVNYSA